MIATSYRQLRTNKRSPARIEDDAENIASTEMLLSKGGRRASDDHEDFTTIHDGVRAEKDTANQRSSRRRCLSRIPPRLPAIIGFFLVSLYLTVAHIVRPSRPYNYMSITLPIAMLDVFSNNDDFCTHLRLISDNPWPLPDVIKKKEWKKPGPNFKGWEPSAKSKLAEEYRRRTPDWLPDSLPRGFFRWDPQRFTKGFLGSYAQGPPDKVNCPDNPVGLNGGLPYYNPITDPLKISNLDNDILEPLREPFANGSVKIKNVVLVLMESLRQEFWPLQQGTPEWDNLMRPHADDTDEEKDRINRLLSEMGPHIEQISGVPGNFRDREGKEYPKAETLWDDQSQPGFGGLNVKGASTSSTMSTKSFGANHCGTWPLPVESFDEADTDAYQPCIPQILELFNKAKKLERDMDDFRNQEWLPALMEGEVEEYDRQEIFDKKLGFKHTVTRTQIEHSPRFNASDVLYHMVNYFGYPEPVLKPFITDLVRDASANKKRLWMSHFTSTTHHAWDTPSDFPNVDYLQHKGSSSWHEDFNKYLNTLRYHDKWMGELMQLFDDLGMTNETLIVFVGDHGQAFKEDFHQVATYDNPHVTNLRVPITFRHPHMPRVQLEVNATSISILPTILDLLASTGSLDARDTEMATDLVQDYEGQSLIRPYKKSDGKKRAWNFTVINSGAGMLAVSSADVPYKLSMPLEKVFEFKVSNLATDPMERNLVAAWTYDELMTGVQDAMGEEAKEWAAEAIAVGKWWVKERKRLWRWRAVPNY
jgi:hypothetical protein